MSGAVTETHVYDGDGKRVKATVNDVATQRASFAAANAAGQTNIYQVTYDTRTGQIAVWRAGGYLGSWTDTTPLTSGSYIALRTDVANVSFDSLIVLSVVKYYYNGGQRIALRRDGTVSYLLTDQLGSTRVTTSDTGVQTAEMKYYPFGATRYNSGGQKTTYRFTGQRFGPGGAGLYDYGARWYDSTIGRFIQADSIVPNPGNPQSLNRYSYVRNNPLRFIDPSGMAECSPGDLQCWGAEWTFKNNWYNARGYFWKGSHWGDKGDPIFANEQVTDEVIADAGIVLCGETCSDRTPWTRDRKAAVARGVAMFGQKLSGGLAHLRQLLGSYTYLFLVSASPMVCGLGGNPCAPPSPWDTGFNVYLPVKAFDAYGSLAHMLVVHELAHVIDWHSSIGGRSFSQAWPYPPITNYAETGWPPPWDRFAEAVAVYVFGKRYESWAGTLRNVDLTVQMSRVHDLLEGWR